MINISVVFCTLLNRLYSENTDGDLCQAAVFDDRRDNYLPAIDNGLRSRTLAVISPRSSSGIGINPRSDK